MEKAFKHTTESALLMAELMAFNAQERDHIYRGLYESSKVRIAELEALVERLTTKLARLQPKGWDLT